MVNTAFWDGLFFMVIVTNIVMMVILSPFASSANLGFQEANIFVTNAQLQVEPIPQNFGFSLASARYLLVSGFQMFIFVMTSLLNVITFSLLLTGMFLNFFGIFGIAWVSISGLIISMWTFIHLQEIMGIVARFLSAIGEIIPL